LAIVSFFLNVPGLKYRFALMTDDMIKENVLIEKSFRKITQILMGIFFVTKLGFYHHCFLYQA
ncbi:hypothetical protein, partial [Holospora curviuscula]|uniref:hypothetical protein n=1 Tax=Holospora curviuscula TaxID=1082868 RepID=UPI001A9C3338